MLSELAADNDVALLRDEMYRLPADELRAGLARVGRIVDTYSVG